MESVGVVFVSIFITISYTCPSVDGVLCFNCVSTESPGCGENLDLSLLVKSSSPRNKRDLTFSSTDFRHRRDLHSRFDHHAHHHTGSDHHPTNNSKSGEIQAAFWRDTKVGILTNLTTESDVDSSGSRSNYTNLTKEFEVKLFGDEKFGDRHKSGFSKSDLNGNERIEIGGERGKFPTNRIANRNGNSPTSHLMVDCPGNTCLTQRIPTTKGNVFVRTCDVSDHVPIDKCHLVTNVLGASVSVVCVCQGHFCNENGESGTTITWAGTSLVIASVMCTILGMYSNSRWFFNM